MPKNKLTPKEIAEAMAFADGGLGAAGHSVTGQLLRPQGSELGRSYQS